ncbi:hypothetical protein B9Z55_027880 [Caenorhabditis nigoni]|uniref:Uncharacterized protein n=1 Tax=Caenorhabditis nigoni TaxID=1611254 RepID=A0A2G5SDS1_9PELO|nr:hypothetical protein B9Z55_027880 [Caenorhabditis nigoni]
MAPCVLGASIIINFDFFEYVSGDEEPIVVDPELLKKHLECETAQNKKHGPNFMKNGPKSMKISPNIMKKMKFFRREHKSCHEVFLDMPVRHPREKVFEIFSKKALLAVKLDFIALKTLENNQNVPNPLNNTIFSVFALRAQLNDEEAAYGTIKYKTGETGMRKLMKLFGRQGKFSTKSATRGI